MATKYQCEKAIKKLSEQTGKNRNVQGYGIGKAKDHGKPEEDGFVVLTYVANMQEVQNVQDKTAKPKAKVKAKPSETVSDEVQVVAKKRIAKNAPKKKIAIKKPKEQEVLPYPTKVETTSRKKKIKIPVQYIETGAFGFS